MTEEERMWSHALYSCEGIGKTTAFKLTELLGSARFVFEAEEAVLREVLPEKSTEAVLRKRETDIQAQYRRILQKGIRVIPFGDEEYPERLRVIPDPPFLLYVKGKLPAEDKPAVAIIGARNASAYGREVAEVFGRELARAGAQIVSGMAYGIDGVSQKSAVAAKGTSIAVLGCGVDVCYPPGHRKLYEELTDNGGIVSEYCPGTPPSAGQFPPRNRIISGLSDVVLVVEAGERSGTLITVDMALEQGKEVMAVPGRISDRQSFGCNRLLFMGATPALTPEQVFRAATENRMTGESFLRERKGHMSNCTKACEGLQESEFLKGRENSLRDRSPVLYGLYGLLGEEPMPIDRIRMEMGLHPVLRGLSLQETMEALLTLCMEGYAGEEGGYYRRQL